MLTDSEKAVAAKFADKPVEIVRVVRIIEYVGPRVWVETTVARSIHGEKLVGHNMRIRAATLGIYPDILEQAIAKEKAT